MRFILLIGALVLAYGSLFFKLYDLQIVQGDRLVARAGSDILALRFLRANRGLIYFTDKRGNAVPVALNKKFNLIYAVPSAIEDIPETANVLAQILGRSAEDLKEIFSKGSQSYVPLVRKADNELSQEISSLGIKGIYVDQESGRFYPIGSLASHVLGFVGPKSDSIGEAGQYGLESLHEDLLRGKHGEIIDGEILRPKPGEDLVLTIDINIQNEAERILASLVNNHDAEGGSVIVIEPGTGKILAMASAPNFDPNTYGKFPQGNFLNPVIQQIYEPGSVFKVITMAAGIDSGKITPETTYNDRGSITMDGWTIKNYDLDKNGPYGVVTMTRVLERSINTGAVFAQRQIGRELFTEYLHKFGFAEKTGIDLPFELGGDLRQLNQKARDVAFATASYGQGVAVTSLGLINAISAIGNGGVLMRPYLNSELEPKVIRRVISEEAARETAGMMVSAVDKAEVAKIKGYTIAGKTGTAFVPDFKYGGYTDKVINTYVGFGPACTEFVPAFGEEMDVSAGGSRCVPRFAALIKLNNPAGAPLAALTVVPAFREIAQFILNYYGVEPDRL